MRGRIVDWCFVLRPWKVQGPLVEEEMNPVLHLSLAQKAIHLSFAHFAIDDSAAFALELRDFLGPDIVRWRWTVLDEIDE